MECKKDLVCEKEKLKRNNTKEHNPNWLQTRDHSCRILIIRGSGSRKENALLILINH